MLARLHLLDGLLAGVVESLHYVSGKSPRWEMSDWKIRVVKEVVLPVGLDEIKGPVESPDVLVLSRCLPDWGLDRHEVVDDVGRQSAINHECEGDHGVDGQCSGQRSQDHFTDDARNSSIEHRQVVASRRRVLLLLLVAVGIRELEVEGVVRQDGKLLRFCKGNKTLKFGNH